MKMTSEIKKDIERRFKLLDDILEASEKMTLRDIRNMPLSADDLPEAVRLYYMIQDHRIKASNATFASVKIAAENGTNNSPILLHYISKSLHDLESDLVKFMKLYVENDPIGRWLTSIPGIGPTFAAALIGYIDISRCQTAGAIWRYAGITGNPELDGKSKGKKISYNPEFKTLCWKIGESFVKVSNREGDIYGHLYKEKRDYYLKKNEEGGFAERAQQILKSKKFDKNTEAYKAYAEGKLPKAHIINMAKRFAVKMFLSHLFEIWYEHYNGEKPPKPFVEAHLGHVHIISAPNREIVFGEKK